MNLQKKYKAGGDICKKVIEKLFEKIKGGESDITKLERLGNDILMTELNTAGLKRAYVAYPTSISLNSCAGHYIYEKGNDRYNNIKEGDVVKIELGVDWDGCIIIKGDSMKLGEGEDNYIKFLNNLKHSVGKFVKGNGEMTNDDVRQFIESKCTEAGCFPIENTFSYQQLDSQCRTEESKWIVLNHKKYWDENDELAVDENICFDIEEGDVYMMNITVVPSTEDEHVWSEKHLPHIYRCNGMFYNLKMKSSREYLNGVKKGHLTNWYVLDHGDDARKKIGFRECFNNGLIDSLPVLYHKGGMNVYHKKFVMIVGKDKSSVI